MEEAVKKAQALVEALPYIRNFHGRTIVIKYGGSAMQSEALKKDFVTDVILTSFIGIKPVIVHGGGPQIKETLDKMGKKSAFVGGMRVTDRETMDVVEMVLSGKINKEIVNLINIHGGRAIGLSGKDGNLIQAARMTWKQCAQDGKEPVVVDLGYVGSVESVDPTVIKALQNEGFMPVIAPVGVGPEGETLNINADLVAVEVAAALKAEKLIFMTDVVGILDKENNLLPTLTREQIEAMIVEGTITGGMIPKVESCVRALDAGVNKSHIIDGRKSHALLLEIFTDKGIGTEILP